MTKLHELLAAEKELEAKALRAQKDIVAMFKQAEKVFVGFQITYEPLIDGAGDLFPEKQELRANVNDELGVFADAFGAWLSVAVEIENSNRLTGANVVVDGQVIFENLPAQALLNLEKKTAQLRKIFASIPTNDPGEDWTFNKDTETYFAPVKKVYRTKKVQEVLTLALATDRHPAQAQIVSYDKDTWIKELRVESAMMPLGIKRRYLDKIDQLIIALKQARQRANDLEVKPQNYARRIFDFIWE